MSQIKKVSLYWFRRDLRLYDNAALYHALKENENVLPVFIFDTNILNKLENKSDRRITFIHGALAQINAELISMGSALEVFHGEPLHIFKLLVEKYDVKNVYANHDYEPYAIQRDTEIKEFLLSKQIELKTYKDHCIFEKNEVVKDNGLPYTVFTPYSRKWKNNLKPGHCSEFNVKEYTQNFFQCHPAHIPALERLGFKKTDNFFKPFLAGQVSLNHYKEDRDFPALDATTKAGVHLRFGTVSIRQLVKKAVNENETWLNELIWREFFMMILWHFPYVATGSFKKEYDAIPWRNNEAEFTRWCDGATGFPLVDAGMRELNTTGFMHNRVRMVVSSFLIKDLLIDWRWGEAYFADKLLDYDLSANNGNWQWAAGCGCDAAPYFRIFNPESQLKKFDPGLVYIKKWIPEFGTPAYPAPMVDHAACRERTLMVYKKTLSGSL